MKSLQSMTAPWADQPTPLVDSANSCDTYKEDVTGCSECTTLISVADARAIEQRMRAEEALLLLVEQAWPNGVTVGAYNKISAYLAAAREMDQANTAALGNLEKQMKVEATVKSKSQRIGEDDEDFLARKPDRVVTVELDDVVTNQDDMKGESVEYVGIRKPNAQNEARHE